MSDPLDFTGRYNTQLTPDQEAQYQQWVQLQSALNHRDMSQDTYNYDMRGAFLGGAGRAGNGHYPDTYKKPNHPSFSDQSQYNGADGQVGGSWTQIPNGGWSFVPGPANLQNHGAQGLQSYFQRSDPTVQLVLPPQPAPNMQDYVRQQMAPPPQPPPIGPPMSGPPQPPPPIGPPMSGPPQQPPPVGPPVQGPQDWRMMAPPPSMQDYVRQQLAPLPPGTLGQPP
jgi:hypothetical protein